MKVCRQLWIGVALVVASSGTGKSATTLSLTQSKSQVVYATIRAGSFATKNLSTTLETRASSDPEYLRRALVKFDTEHTIPKGTSIASAVLTMTVKDASGDATRRVAAYQMTTSWTETEVTWKNRRNGEPWNKAGGDLGSRLSIATVSNATGAKASFDVTPLVRDAVAGKLGTSRYTRIALLDLDESTHDSWRSYYTADASGTQRPTLTVTFGSGSAPPPPPAKPAPPPTGSGKTLRVLHWNTHHGGVGTDGVWSPSRLVQQIAKVKPDVVSLNEMEYKDSYTGGTDEPATIASLLKQQTGKTWYYKFAVGSGATTGIGNMLLSTVPFDAVSVYHLDWDRVAIDAAITVNGRTVNLITTHLDADSSSRRVTQVKDLMHWAGGLAEQRIVCGDFNASASATESNTMKASYVDTWAEAQAENTDIAYAGNDAGNTRNSRIDYIYYSKNATKLRLVSSQVFDVRDSHGVMPSDHRPVMSTFSVQ
jgi:endonuclease/exonuclease/phosphatase family metal-dependent hydrolase